MYDIIETLKTKDDFVRVIDAVNPDKDESTLQRRLIKIIEELGEVSEAYLGVTSEANRKGMTWDDVREEIIDTYIVMVDCLWTKHNGETEQQSLDYAREREFSVTEEINNPEDFIRLVARYWARADTEIVEPISYYNYYQIMRQVVFIGQQAIFLRLPHDEGKTDADIEAEVVAVMKAKLTKWLDNVGGVITQSNNSN